MESVLGLLAVFVLVGVNGFFVAAEFGLVGARQTRLAQLAAEGHAGAKSAQEAIHHLDSYIAATQLGITLASLGLGWIGEPAVAHLIEPVFQLFMTEEMIEQIGHPVSVALAFSLVTVLHIVLGELAPKSIALQRPEGTSIIVSRPTTLFLRIFNPVIHFMNAIGNLVVRLLGFEPAAGHTQVHSVEELHMLVRSSREAGVLERSEEQLLHRVFDFGGTTVEEIMQPRVEVDAIPLHATLPEILAAIKANEHSRYPVYEKSIDNVVGVLHTRDLLDTLIHNPALLTREDGPFDLTPMLHTPLFVPESVHVDKLLERMQKTRTHLAIVIDEYGGMAGVATMEDILEEIVGEVQDEFDYESSPIRAEGDIALVDGLVSLGDIEERFGECEGEVLSTTIGGYVAERLGRIPTKGDVVPYGAYQVIVDEMDGMRVAKVRFTHLPTGKPGGADKIG